MALHLEIRLLDGRFALALLPRGSAIPEPATPPFTAVVHSAEGISVVCREGAVAGAAKSRNGFRCFEVAGQFDLEAVGVVAAVARPLAEASVSLFVYSTWQTDYVLVQENDLDIALAALRQAGHRVA